MTEGKVMNRWHVVIGAVLIQLCLGCDLRMVGLYAWGSVSKFCDQGGVYGFSATQAAWIFSVGLLVFSVAAIIPGTDARHDWPEKAGLLGGIVLGAGYILAGFFGSSFMAQMVFIGIIGGAGRARLCCPYCRRRQVVSDKKDGNRAGCGRFDSRDDLGQIGPAPWFGLIENLNFFGLWRRAECFPVVRHHISYRCSCGERGHGRSPAGICTGRMDPAGTGLIGKSRQRGSGDDRV